MGAAGLLRQARESAHLAQAELAQAAGTSQSTLSSYELGRKSPTLDTAARIVAAAGFAFTLTPAIEFTVGGTDRGRPILVPHPLPRLPLSQALATVELPLHLQWSDPGRAYDLRIRRQRARVYEIVLREGEPPDILTYVDGALLIDLWNELTLPAAIRAAWAPTVAAAPGPELDVA